MADAIGNWTTWIHKHDALVGLLGLASLVMFVGSLVLLPVVVARIPRDYFTRETRPPPVWGQSHVAVRAAAMLLKNAIGILLLLAGIAMLLLPGQGLLAIFLGIMLLDFPGKFRFQQWLIGRPSLLRSINWMRRRANREPLLVGRTGNAPDAKRNWPDAGQPADD